ncbi:hypothetical protein POTOM_046323 [Populus tomentosa]|uniref:Uncharacterized protein n=1 Tax=Populus tomentosa TaxID=118781 RepID=A0A8X7YFT3_POPTO|nr:hypothetical protein POTOM_046323 [Populus tomentosa]
MGLGIQRTGRVMRGGEEMGKKRGEGADGGVGCGDKGIGRWQRIVEAFAKALSEKKKKPKRMPSPES